ncbi:ATP-binding protein [Roseivivax sp.]
MARLIDPQFFVEVGGVAYAALRRSRRMFLGGALLTVGTVLFVGLVVYVDYQRTLDSGRARLAHVATLFNQTFASSMELASAQISGVAGELARAPIGSPEDVEAQFGGRLRAIAASSEQIDEMLIADPEGRVVWASTAPLIGVDVGDRAYFRDATALPAGRHTLGVPITARTLDTQVTPVAWPIRSPDGGLRGVIASSLDAAYFEALLARTRLDPEMLVEIVSAQGPIAFSSAGPETAPEGAALIESQRGIPGSDLSTRVAVPRGEALEGFWLRSVSFAAIALSLYACALAAAFIAEKRAVALARALARLRDEAARAVAAGNQFQAIFQNVDDGIVVFDEAGAVANANRRARELLGVRNAEAAVALVKPHRPGQDAGQASGQNAGQTAGQGRKRTTVALSRRVEGQTRELRCRISHVGNVEGDAYYCVLSDVTAEERLARTRGRFVQSINHELRTPLTAMAGSLDLFLTRFGGELAPSGRKLVELSKGNADRMLMLVDDILTLQAIDQNQLVIEPAPTRATEIVTDVAAALAGYAENFSVTLRVEPGAEGRLISVDRRRVQQALVNLVTNAIKYSPPGGEVVLGASARQGGALALWVRDQGPGIPDHARAAIFERFARPAHAPGVQVTGTGLGLAIARELVERQGGAVELDTRHAEDGASTETQGSTFRLVFPAAAPDTPEIDEARHEDPVGR